jgi:hypothetical protein
MFITINTKQSLRVNIPKPELGNEKLKTKKAAGAVAAFIMTYKSTPC